MDSEKGSPPGTAEPRARPRGEELSKATFSMLRTRTLENMLHIATPIKLLNNLRP